MVATYVFKGEGNEDDYGDGAQVNVAQRNERGEDEIRGGVYPIKIKKLGLRGFKQGETEMTDKAIERNERNGENEWSEAERGNGMTVSEVME